MPFACKRPRISLSHRDENNLFDGRGASHSQAYADVRWCERAHGPYRDDKLFRRNILRERGGLLRNTFLLKQCIKFKFCIPQHGRALETSLDVDRVRSYRMRENNLCKNLFMLCISHIRHGFRENFVLLRWVTRRLSETKIWRKERDKRINEKKRNRISRGITVCGELFERPAFAKIGDNQRSYTGIFVERRVDRRSLYQK